MRIRTNPRPRGKWTDPNDPEGGCEWTEFVLPRLVRGRSVRPGWGSPWGSLGVDGFVVVRLGGLRYHSGSLGSLGYALGVVGFVRGRWVHFHWGAPWGSCGSFGFIGAWSLGKMGYALEVVGFIRGTPWGITGFIGVHHARSFVVDGFLVVRPGAHRVHRGHRGGWLGSLGYRLGR